MRLLANGGRWLLALVGVVALVAWDMGLRSAGVAPAQAVLAQATDPWAPDTAWQVAERGQIPMPAGMPAAHASTLVAMPAGHPAALTAFWFSGDRESAPNVQIAASQWDRTTQRWLPARLVVDRHVLGDALQYGVRRLGNPVAWLDAQGQLHLYVVATGAGGWAASRVLHLRQSSAGSALGELAFAPERALPLSWLWNTSYLVRNAPLPLADGGAVLPVHFELGIKVPAAVRLDAQGRLLAMTRMSQRDFLLQPALVALSPTHWLAFLRDDSPKARIGVVATQDGGRHWEDRPDLPLVNPDSAVAALGLASHYALLVHNASAGSRNRLDLSASPDGERWHTARILEQGQGPDEYSYPALLWHEHALWVSYTVDRHRIAWQRLVPSPAPSGGTP